MDGKSPWVNGPVIIGADIQGLAVGAYLRDQGIPFEIVEHERVMSAKYVDPRRVWRVNALKPGEEGVEGRYAFRWLVVAHPENPVPAIEGLLGFADGEVLHVPSWLELENENEFPVGPQHPNGWKGKADGLYAAYSTDSALKVANEIAHVWKEEAKERDLAVTRQRFNPQAPNVISVSRVRRP